MKFKIMMIQMIFKTNKKKIRRILKLMVLFLVNFNLNINL